MTEDELAELEVHLAAGTDVPTAFAALPQGRQRSPLSAVWWWIVLGVGVVVAMWVLR